MRTITMVLLLTVIALGLVGCNRGWTGWLLRGDPCTTCTSSVESSSTLPPPARLPEPLP